MRAALSLVLLVAAVSAFGAPPLERPITDDTYGTPPYPLTVAGSATDGNSFEILWSSNSTGLFASHAGPNGDVSRGGQVRITGGWTGGASIVWTGEAYLVTWTEGYQIYASALDRDGQIVVPPHVVVTSGSTGDLAGALASNGKNALLLYTKAPGIMYGLLLDRRGNVVKADIIIPTIVVPGFYVHLNMRVATDGDGYAVFWFSTATVLAKTAASPFPPIQPTKTVSVAGVARVSAAGDVIDATPRSLGQFGPMSELFVAYAAGRYAVTFVEDAKALHRLIVDAKTLDVQELPVMGTTRYGARVTSDNSRFILYGFDSGLWIAPFSGAAESAPPEFTRAVSTGAAIAGVLSPWTGNGFLFAWSYGPVFATPLDAAFRAGATKPVAFSRVLQAAPALASGAGVTVAVWFESESMGIGSLRAIRLLSNGAILDDEPLTIGMGSYRERPSIVAVGSGFFIFWNSPDGVHGRRLNPDGTLGTEMSYGGASYVSAASNGSMILLAFYGVGGLLAIRLNDSGRVLDGSPLDVGAKSGYAFRVASNGSDFLMVWTEGSNYWQFPSMPNRRDVLGARVMANGSVDASPISIATGPADQGDPEVASDGRDYLVVYSETSPSDSASKVGAKRILREGVLADTTPEAPGTLVGSQDNLPRDVSHTSEGYFVLWEQRVDPYRMDLLLRRLSDSGVPSGDVSVVASDPNPMEGALNDAAPLLVAYARIVDDPNGPPVNRVFLRTLSPLPRTRGVRQR